MRPNPCLQGQLCLAVWVSSCGGFPDAGMGMSDNTANRLRRVRKASILLRKQAILMRKASILLAGSGQRLVNQSFDH